MHGLKILKPGPLTLVQDRGRKGFQHFGLAQGGAIDPYARFQANRLLGNAEDAACLEITLGPFTAEFQAATMIAISGADLHCSINDIPVPNWQSHRVKAGDVIHFRPGNHGLRAYLAVAGGFQTHILFGSRSEVPREKLAPLQVQENAVLPYAHINPAIRRITAIPERLIPDYNDYLVLHIFPAYQHALFSEDARATFCAREFSISSNSDRMGYRLDGESVAWQHGAIISEGIALGSVQIPPDGQPIVLLNDRQTLGGYPKIGCVLAEDCAQLAQRRPGQKVQFEFIHTLSRRGIPARADL